MAGLSRNSSHLCVNPAEGKKWLTCLSVISTLLDDTRDWLELPQIQASCCVGCRHWLSVQVEPSIPRHQPGICALQAPSCLIATALHSWAFCAFVSSMEKPSRPHSTALSNVH